MLPGLTLLVVGRLLQGGARGFSHVRWEQFLAIAFMVIVFAGTWLMNRTAARVLQDEIDALDALEGKSE
jgi:hypothetical protein